MTPPGVVVSAGLLSGVISTALVSTFHGRLLSFGTVSDKFSVPLFDVSVSLTVTSGGGGLGFESLVAGCAGEVGGDKLSSACCVLS